MNNVSHVNNTSAPVGFPTGANINIEIAGRATCPHVAWRDAGYNDWGFPYYVVECRACGRRLSSAWVQPNVPVTEGSE